MSTRVLLGATDAPPWAGRSTPKRGVLDAPEQFAAWASERVEAGTTGTVMTVEAPGLVALRAARSIPELVRTLDDLLAGHVLAYAALKARSPHVTVALGTAVLPVYELALLPQHVLVSRAYGVGRDDLHGWLTERRAAFDAALPVDPTRLQWARRLARAVLPLEQALPRTVTAVAASDVATTVDAVHVVDPPLRGWRERLLLGGGPVAPVGRRQLAAEPALARAGT